LTKNIDTWNSGDPYEYFMGRWSKLMAPVFLKWLNLPSNMYWLDIGCGTGALSEVIFHKYKPAYLCCVDPSTDFLEKAKEKNSFQGDFFIGNASDIPLTSNTFDIVVSGLALNFFPDLSGALVEMKRVLKRNGTIAAYVWDYADRMDFLRLFWDAAREVDANAANFDEGIRFPICNAENLADVFQKAGLTSIETASLDINTVFKDFNDYWNPFLGGQGPAPSYLSSLDKNLQDKIKNILSKKLSADSNSSIKLLARAIAVRGIFKQ
jgi:ubiquinone/menaquinone biosynthesis C-methylase UbiE